MNAYVGNEPFVFVSYAHSDKQIAESVIIGLKQKMCRVFYDDGLTPGDSWNDELAKKVIKCECLVVLLTNNSASSKYVRTELNFAIAKDKTIIPVMIGKISLPPGIEMMLSPYQFIDVDPVNDKYYLENLVEKLINALPINVFSTNKDHKYQEETVLWVSDDESISARQQLKELYKEKNRKWWIAHALATGSLMVYLFYLNTLSGVNNQQMILYYVLCTYAILVSPFLKPIEPDDALRREILRTKYFFANLLVSFIIQALVTMAAQYLLMWSAQF